MNPSFEDRKKQMAESAVACERDRSVPAELVYAQCYIESGALLHAPGNNCFGIKEYDGCYGRQLLHTKERFTESEVVWFIQNKSKLGRTAVVITGSHADAKGRLEYAVQDWFATFASLADCFNRRAILFRVGVYLEYTKKYERDHDLEALVQGIAPHYATAGDYAEVLLNIIHNPETKVLLDYYRHS